MRGFSEDKYLTGEQLEFRQLQQELSGAVGIRLLRFLTPEMIDLINADKRAQKREEQFSKLVRLLLSDPLYRQSYERAWDTLETYERRAEQALEKIRSRVEELDGALQETRSRSARLPDGTRVFRDANGKVRNEKGEVIDGAALDAVIWPDNAPSYDSIAALRDERAALETQARAIEGYQINILGDARDKLSDQESPMSREDVDAIERRIGETAPAAISQSHLVEPDAKPQRFTSVAVPEL